MLEAVKGLRIECKPELSDIMKTKVGQAFPHVAACLTLPYICCTRAGLIYSGLKEHHITKTYS